ncbi:MAG TPA: hypothetical protein VGE84_02620 [Allosphingosinicella sp.]
MTLKPALLAATACALLLSACAATTSASAPVAAPPAPPAASAATQTQAAEQLHALFKAADEDNLRRNPLSALFRGDKRYADQLGD